MDRMRPTSNLGTGRANDLECGGQYTHLLGIFRMVLLRGVVPVDAQAHGQILEQRSINSNEAAAGPIHWVQTRLDSSITQRTK